MEPAGNEHIPYSSSLLRFIGNFVCTKVLNPFNRDIFNNKKIVSFARIVCISSKREKKLPINFKVNKQKKANKTRINLI